MNYGQSLLYESQIAVEDADQKRKFTTRNDEISREERLAPTSSLTFNPLVFFARFEEYIEFAY